MGITIHYKTELKKTKENKDLINKIISFVEETAKRFNYEYFISKNEEGFVEKMRTTYLNKTENIHYFTGEFFDEDSDLNPKFKRSGFEENEYSKKIKFNSICVNNKINGEFMSESFEVGFYYNPFTKKYGWFGSGFTKTQIFNEEETMPNLKFHIYIIKVLEQIKLRFLPNLYISDEGNFFFTEQDRQANLKWYEEELKKGNKIYEKYIKEWKTKKPYSIKELVKAHTGNLSLIKSVGGVLGNLGHKESSITTPIKDGDEFLKIFYKKLCDEVLGI